MQLTWVGKFARALRGQGGQCLYTKQCAEGASESARVAITRARVNAPATKALARRPIVASALLEVCIQETGTRQ